MTPTPTPIAQTTIIPASQAEASTAPAVPAPVAATPAPLSGVNKVVTAITTQTLTYAPAVIAAVQVAEQTNQSGAGKLQTVLSAVGAGSQALETSPNATVDGIAALVNLVVSIFNATGLFQHKSA